MIVQKILALLALLSSLTGCTGADALSPAGNPSAAPYPESAAPIIAEADAAPTDSGRTDSGIFPTEATARNGASDTQESTPFAEEAPSPAKGGGTDSAPLGVPEKSPAEGRVTADTTALYSLFSPYSGDTLQPRDDYGPLLPFVGGMAEEGSALWGFATDDGQVVTDPAYASIKPFGPFFLLYKAVEGGESAEMGLDLCGKDGSWTMPAGNIHHCILLDGVGLAAALEDGSVIILAADGVITHTFSRAHLEKYLGEGYSWDDDCREVVYAGGPIAVCRWDENSPYGNGAAYDCFIDPVTGDITGEPPDGFAPEDGFGEPDEEPSFPGYSYPDRMEDITTGTVYYWGERDGVSDLLDSRGNVLMADFFTPGSGGLWEPVIGSGLAGTIKDGAFQFAKISSGEVVFRYPLRS